jgi:DNA-binding protein YbaB
VTGVLFAQDPDAAQDRVADWAASVSERAERAKELADRVAALSVSASGSDGAVVVTVAGSGLVTDIRLDDRVLRWSGSRISQEILAVMRRAQARLASQVAAAAEQTVGLDSQTGTRR